MENVDSIVGEIIQINVAPVIEAGVVCVFVIVISWELDAFLNEKIIIFLPLV